MMTFDVQKVTGGWSGERLCSGLCSSGQEVGNDVTPKRAVYKFSEFTHLVSQLDHARSRLGLCSPDKFGRPLGIRKIVAVGAPMQTRPQTAPFIAYEFGEFQPGALEIWLTTRGYFPSEVNRVHDILSGCGRSRAFAKTASGRL